MGQCCGIHLTERLQHVADIGNDWLHVQPPSTLSLNSSEDVELPVRVQNRRFSHGLILVFRKKI